MPFIEINLNETQESKALPIGRYDVTVVSCEEVPTKKDPSKTQFKLMLTVDGHDNAMPINHYQGIPTDPKEFKALLMKRFLTLFKIPIDPRGLDTEKIAMELVGARANVALEMNEYEGRVSNTIVVPPLSDESSMAAGRGTGKPPKRG